MHFIEGYLLVFGVTVHGGWLMRKDLKELEVTETVILLYYLLWGQARGQKISLLYTWFFVNRFSVHTPHSTALLII